MSRRASSSRRFAPVLSLLVLSACTTVLGIEDVEEDPNAGSGGTTTTDVQGGTKNTGGTKAGSSPTGGANASGDGPGSMGGDGTIGGGSGPMGGDANMAGDAMGGAPSSTDPTVHGMLVDFYGNKVPNMPIMVGATLTNTDEDGEFVVEDVPEVYDVGLAFDVVFYGNTRQKAYAFQGLTRRDPTIQVRQSFEIRYGTATVTPTNATLATGDKIKLAIGGDTGNISVTLGSTGGSDQSCNWQGSETAKQTAHALHLSIDADSELPTAYKAYDTSNVGLAETGKSQVSLDLTPKTVVSGNLQGTAITGGGSDRENWVYLRFDSGAVMELLNDTDGPNTFTYLVPTLPSSTITVGASEGWEMVDGPYAMVYKTGLAAGDKPELKIPTPVTLAAPANGITNVNNTTKFKFTSPASNPGPFVVHFENVDLMGNFQDLYIVTADKELTIPDVLDGGFALQAGKQFRWNVETHGPYASVDEMTGPDGFWDLFTWEGGPVGPLTDDGEWTNSQPRYFTAAP